MFTIVYGVFFAAGKNDSNYENNILGLVLLCIWSLGDAILALAVIKHKELIEKSTPTMMVFQDPKTQQYYSLPLVQVWLVDLVKGSHF